LFLHSKKRLAGQKFHEDKEVKNEVTTWLCAQAAEFYDIGIQKLVPRLNKASTKVEEQLKVCVKSLFYSILLINILKKLYRFSLFTFWITLIFRQQGNLLHF
jgi:hypothetical protein